jgi:hypothetical protein
LCSCHCISCIALSSPRRFSGESLLRFLLLGSWNPRRLSGLLGDLQLSCEDRPKLCGASVAIMWGPPIKLWRISQALWCLSGDSWEPPIKLWRLPQACTDSVTALKCPIVHRIFHIGGGTRGDYSEPLWHLGCLVPPHHLPSNEAHLESLSYRGTLSPAVVPIRWFGVIGATLRNCFVDQVGCVLSMPVEVAAKISLLFSVLSTVYTIISILHGISQQ